MGFSTSAAVAVLSIGLLICVGALYPVVEQSALDVSDANERQHDRMMDARNSDVVIHDATHNTSEDTLTVIVNNTGTVTMSTEHTDLLLDGRVASDRTTYVDGERDRELWVPGEPLRIEVENVTETPDRVVVATERGLSRATETVEVT